VLGFIFGLLLKSIVKIFYKFCVKAVVPWISFTCNIEINCKDFL
jgi:hypothetical protein